MFCGCRGAYPEKFNSKIRYSISFVLWKFGLKYISLSDRKEAIEFGQMIAVYDDGRRSKSERLRDQLNLEVSNNIADQLLLTT